MCKKLTLLILTLTISLSVCGCNLSDSDMDIYEKIHKKYLKMESYTADLDMTVFSNKTENRYFVTQKSQVPDKFYTRVTDPDGLFSVTTVTDGAVTRVDAEGSDYAITVPSDDYMNLLFVNNFLTAYYASESTYLSVDSSLIKGNNTSFSVDIDESGLCIRRACMTFDNDSLAPQSITIYGENEQILATAKYENFNFNENIDPSVFNTD